MPCPNTRRKVNLKSSSLLFSVIGVSLISNISFAEQTALWGEGTTVNQGVPVTLPPAQTQEVAPPDFYEIISKTSTSAIFTGADKFTEELLESISDSGLSSGAISSIARNVKNRLANLNLQSAGASTASFGKDVIVGMLVDFIAEEAMNYQIQRSGNLSTLRAATTYVLIKQGYILATSKGPAGIIVGQAGLLRDIAIKDIQAIQEYTEAKDIADYAELRAEMWEAYGEYVQAFSYTATNPNTDLVNEQITETIEDAAPTDPGPTDPTDPVDPVDPPVQPTVTLRGSFSYTGADGRTTSSQTSWRGGLAGPLTKGSDGGELLAFHLDSYGTVGSAGIVSKASDTAASFSDNLSWGRWAGTYSPGGPGACTQDPDGSLYCGVRDYTGGLWIVGTPSTSSQFALRTGTATYSGGFIGDFDNGTSIEQGKVSGNFQLNVDFGSRALTGNAEFTLDNGASVWDYASISGNLDTTQEDPMLWGTLTPTGPGLSYGSSGDMSGRFYGSGADEVAGAFRYSGIGGVASGIWAGFEGGTPVAGEQWEGFLAAKVTGQSSLFTRSGVVIDGDSSNPPSAGQNTFTTNGLSPGITTGTTKGDYTYTAWGQWNGSGVTLDSQPIEQASIVIGRLTQPSDMPSSGTRNFGGATHNSEVAGIGFNGEQIAGTISLGADFSNGHVGGQFDFTADGNQWVNGTISNTPIQGNRFNGNGSNMNINQGGSGNLSGAFFGESAQEVAGEWAIWNVPGAVSGADGVFRAKQ